MSITKGMVATIQEEGARAYPNEACGLVIKKGKRQVLVTCKNASASPQTHFLIGALERAAITNEGEIVGVWHTHVEASSRPSVVDRAACEDEGVPWYIVGVFKTPDGFSYSEMSITTPSGFELPYLERPYAFGVLDCFSLVRDFYKRDMGIEIEDGPREEGFWRKGMNPFGEGWEERGFVRLTKREEPQVGDIFLIQTTDFGVPDHIAVYIGNDVILHHCHMKLSRRDIYGGYWQKHTTHHLRHKSKC